MSNASATIANEFIAFRVGTQEFCVDIMSVREIRGWTPATALPHAPPYLRGVINLRGSVLRLLHIALGADIIAGFPTETEEMFCRSQDLVEECGLTFLHVFPYSPRPATPAARMPQVKGSEIRERAKRLRGTAEAALQRRLTSELGHTRQVPMRSAR